MTSTHMDQAIDIMVAVLPFLPQGKGATILILGGILVVAFAFVLSLFSGRAEPSAGRRSTYAGVSAVARGHAPRLEQARTAPLPVHQAPDSDDAYLGWARPVVRAASSAGIGPMTVLNADPERVVVRLDGCGSCQRGIHRGNGCVGELSVMVTAVVDTRTSARVEEVMCHQWGHGVCVFEIDRGHTE